MIEIKNLTKKYDSHIAINNISFSIKKGEIIGFLGPNGAGKTTTMKLITSFLDPNKGSIEVAGLDVQDNLLHVRKKIGYLPEMVPLYDELLVYEYLKFVAEIREIPKNKINIEVKETAKECGLEEVITKPIDELSKGYRQRVGLAQAIIHKPDILILDEPTTGLDPNQIIEIRKLIKKIGQEKTVIFSTHILSEASAISDKIIIINKGQIVAQGSPLELQEKTKKKLLYRITLKGERYKALQILEQITGINKVSIHKKESLNIYEYHLEPTNNEDMREIISKQITANNYSILEFSRTNASLEDVFRELTI